MARARRQHRLSNVSNSSSSSTSPERGVDDDNDSFMMQANDSQSSLALSNPADDLTNAEYEARCRESPVYRLPAELLISIFARLSSTKDLQSCMLVSKEWARNSVGLLWHRPQTNNWSSVQSVVRSIRKADKFFAYQDLVKRLNLSTLAGQVSDGTIEGMEACKRIERLTLTNCNKLSDLRLRPLIEGNKSLIALDVTGLDQLTDQTLTVVAENCLRLQGLNITGCRQLTDASLMAVARNCKHLKRLKCNSCFQLTDNSILTVAAHSTHLLEIDLFDLPLLESASVAAIMTSCPNLRELRLARCPRITDSAFLSIPSKTPPFDALRILDLTDCQELGDKAIERIVTACPRLRNLILAKCRQLTDRAVWAITKLGKNLHYIHLGHCARITDPSIIALAKACNRIRYIDLACCSNLTDASITQLANLPKLKRVGLVKCAGITDRSIVALATYGGRIFGKPRDRHATGVSVLERVHLSYCTLLTLNGIHTLLNNCPRLTHLSLTGVQAFLREDLTVFCREAPSEFNDHQREVFCVFSGNGVARLREYLNGGGNTARDTGIVDSDDDDGDTTIPPQQHHHHHHHHAPQAPHPAQMQWQQADQDTMEDEDMVDDDETTPGELADNAPPPLPPQQQQHQPPPPPPPHHHNIHNHQHLLNLNIHSSPSNTQSHLIAPPPSGVRALHEALLADEPGFGTGGSSAGNPSGGGGALWASGLGLVPAMAIVSANSAPPLQTTAHPPPPLSALGTASPSRSTSAGEARSVTGMLGATILDDVEDRS